MKNYTPSITENPSPPGIKNERKPNHSDKIPQNCSVPEEAYETVRRENSSGLKCKLDMGTFITTHTDKFASRLMNDAAHINYACAEANHGVRTIAGKCINILANLWNTPVKTAQHPGIPTIGSSDACMLAGVAAWSRWKERRRAQGLGTEDGNFVVSAARHPAWDRFAKMWGLSIRIVPLTDDRKTLDPAKAVGMCDENTFMVVAIAGDTYSGLNDNVEELDKALTKFNSKNRCEIPIHVDAAIGGFILPFLYPDVKWDFRLKNVCSINTSAHKFGLVYSGLGWLVWKDIKYSIDPGKPVADGFTNTRPSAQILAQYYQFLRLGFDGYQAVMNSCMEVAGYTCREISQMGPFRCESDHIESPFFSWSMDPDYAKSVAWTMQDLRDELRANGWTVHLLTLPYVDDHKEVLRLVFRRSMGRDVAERLLGDIREIVKYFEEQKMRA